MKRLRAAIVAAAIFACAVFLVLGETGHASDSASARTVTVRLGDQVRVEGAPLGCRVVRMRELHGSVVVDCRRAGPLRGSYGTLLTAREAALVRFESSHTGRLVYIAKHQGAIHRCGLQQ
jgi:hypothetical protein